MELIVKFDRKLRMRGRGDQLVFTIPKEHIKLFREDQKVHVRIFDGAKKC